MMRYQIIGAISIVLFITSLAYSYQIRNSYSRTTSDMRGIANALEMYFIDNHQYPIPTDIPPYGLEKLTTPVAYIINIQPDVFSNPDIQPNIDDPKSLNTFFIKRQQTIIFVAMLPLILCITLIGLYLKNVNWLKYLLLLDSFGFYSLSHFHHTNLLMSQIIADIFGR